MPRRNAQRRRDRRGPGTSAVGPTAGNGAARSETGPDGQSWFVRPVGPAQALKPYRCPGCDHEIAVGTPHVVAWPSDEFGGAAERRHWHRGCWVARGRRGITRRWS